MYAIYSWYSPPQTCPVPQLCQDTDTRIGSNWTKKGTRTGSTPNLIIYIYIMDSSLLSQMFTRIYREILFQQEKEARTSLL